MDGGPAFFLLSVFLISHSCCSFTHALPLVWINEVYNNFTNLTHAFVEIYDGGFGNLTLSNISLELEKNNESPKISLNNMTTNEDGFLVLSLKSADNDTKKLLKIIQSETVTLKLTSFEQSNNESRIIDIFKKEKGWSDVMRCFHNESEVTAIVLVGKEPTMGKQNNCPSSPVRLDLFMYRAPLNLSVQLISHNIDKFSLNDHLIKLFENNTLLDTFSLTNYSTEKKKVNISMDVSKNFNVNQTYRINLEIQTNSNTSLLESLYFGALPAPVVNLSEVFQTYPDKNPAQRALPAYLQIDQQQSMTFASCYCEVSASTYNPFVSLNSSVSRKTTCQEKCQDLITKPPTASQITSSSSPDTKSTITTGLPSHDTTIDLTTMDQSDTDLTETTTHFKSSTMKEDLTTEGTSSSTVAHSTEKSSTTATSETDSSATDFHKYSTFPSLSETTPHSKILTSTVHMTTETPLLPLFINEIKVGSQPTLDHWIELKGNTSSEKVSSYMLVLNVSDEKTGTIFDLKSLQLTDKNGLLYINFSTPDASKLSKKLHTNAGVLRLFSSKILPTNGKTTGLADCVAYQVGTKILEKKLVDLCPLHKKVRQVTLRELHENWTIGRCNDQFEVLEPSPSQSNKCPSLRFSKSVYMKILKRKLDTNFKTYFLSSLVQKLSTDKGCMLSTAFFLNFSANNSGDDINIHSLLAAPNPTKRNALYMCFKTLFHKKPVELQLGSDKVSVYRCYNSSFIIPTAAEATKGFSGKSKTLAIAITLLVLFVCVVTACCIYMRYKRKTVFETLGIARYNADQDDLLVNMEEVGRLDTNFRNPTYSQLTAY